MTISGVSFNSTAIPETDALVVEDVAVAAGSAGTLTTRSGDTAGTVTTTDAHTITTGQRVDLYWDGGCRRGCVAGTVVVKAIPITGGAGDVLPTQTTAMTIVVPILMDIAVLGTNVDVILLYSSARGQFVFVTDVPAEIYAVTLAAGASWDWTEVNGIANPLTGQSVAGVYVSHGGVAAATMRAGLLYNN
jgi:hypothetical protein